MKKLLLLIMFLIGFSGFSQEKRKYEKINEKEINVKVYYDDVLIQQGKMLNYNGVWVNNGLWSQYNKEGKVDLTAFYDKGRRIRISKEFDSYVLVLNKKGVN